MQVGQGPERGVSVGTSRTQVTQGECEGRGVVRGATTLGYSRGQLKEEICNEELTSYGTARELPDAKSGRRFDSSAQAQRCSNATTIVSPAISD